ncbi:MAG TPA: tRNA (guanosine(37)-N1)-methyltransferase TrmD [Bacillota bacterium]|nr:tRNA (guanosine(37)-N1)-methyltransferase TrmD [Bacillota bacterium]
MLLQIMTLFPEMFDGPFSHSIIKRAQEQKLVEISLLDFREYAFDKHRMVDDTPYGGGSGMVLKPEPIYRCLQDAKAGRPQSKVVLMTPQGIPFQQAIARDLAREEHLIMICGHYEGFDERIRNWVDLELSIGDFVLTGGELAAMVVTDAVVRLIPGVLGSDESALNDSYSAGLLDYPHYTRPVEFEGLTVPDILLSGHHANIEAWRRKEALLRTAQRRPDLLKNLTLSEKEKEILRNELNMEI